MKFSNQKYLLIPVLYLIGCATAYADDKGACSNGDLDAKGNCVSMWDAYEWPESYFDSKLDKVAYESHGLGYSDNCLFFASNVQKRLSSEFNVTSQIYYVIVDNKDHAVVCDNKNCVDNGYISDEQFSKTDLAQYNVVGEVKFAEGQPYVINEKGLTVLAHWDPNFKRNSTAVMPGDVELASTK
jgi:hypothetical protein